MSSAAFGKRSAGGRSFTWQPLTGVDESLYEAAYLDGASKLQRLIYVTLPSIKSVVVTMLILQVSKNDDHWPGRPSASGK